MKITVITPAKTNLRLVVGERLSNGYHDVNTVMQAVSLYDLIELETAESGISISVSGPFADGVPTDERNLCFKAAAAIMSDIKYGGGIAIHIKKHIPHGAGLGGGSSDAAAVLKGINELSCARLSETALELIGCSLGADVPFFIRGGCQTATGIGMDLSPCEYDIPGHILIAKGAAGSATKAAYERLDGADCGTDSGADCDNAKCDNAKGGNDNSSNPFFNSFNQVVTNDEIVFIKETMKDASFVSLCGSGSAVFGIFDSKPVLFRTKKILREAGFFTEAVEPAAHGSRISWEQT
jgi:4-diphosphocytidyl-2-C-methyl-D-erythritol kinase